jgi:hypothetical protein
LSRKGNSGSYSFVWHQSYLGAPIAHQNFPNQPSKFIFFLIVGGGISGLSAARQFSKGIHDFSGGIRNHLGGNSSSGENKYSKYPLEFYHCLIKPIKNCLIF